MKGKSFKSKTSGSTLDRGSDFASLGMKFTQ